MQILYMVSGVHHTIPLFQLIPILSLISPLFASLNLLPLLYFSSREGWTAGPLDPLPGPGTKSRYMGWGAGCFRRSRYKNDNFETFS